MSYEAVKPWAAFLLSVLPQILGTALRSVFLNCIH